MSAAYINQLLKRHKKLPKYEKFIADMSGDKKSPPSFSSIVSTLNSMPRVEDA